MLQHNNNNNYPCLDVAHRELLHGCRRNGTTFSSALGFGAIPLIKGLRAWAVSGGYSRSKRKTAAASQASDTAHESRIGSIHRKTHSFHTPGVRQGGLGALVTVATLKDSDGGRQTQTRCLFLNAEGCNYLCTVGTRVDGRKSEKGSQDGLGISDGRPVRKWRKSNKRPKSMENISLVENKEGDSSTKPELLDKHSITQCLQAKSALTAINNDEEHANGSQFSVKEDTTLASCPKLNYSFGDQDIPISTSDCTENTTELSQNESEFIAEVTLNHVLKSKESAMPYSEKHSPGFEVVMHKKNGILSTISHNHTTHTILTERNLNKSSEFDMEKSKQHGVESEIVSADTNKTNGTNSHFEEAIINPAFSNLSDDTFLTVSQVEREIKNRKDESSLNNEMEKIVHFGEMKKVNHLKEPAEEHLGSPVCSFHQKQEVIMEVNMTFKEGGELNATNETFEELANSLSQGSGFFIVANAITSSSNPAPTTNATALRAMSSQQQEETEGMRLAVKPALEQFKKQERGQEEENVADEELGVVDEADEDEFGIFMKAGDEQIWNAGFNELKKVPCEKNVGIDITNSSVSNEPLSLMSDWTRDLSVRQSEDIWTAFKQEVASRGAEKECWFSTAVENMHLTHSSLNTVERAGGRKHNMARFSPNLPTSNQQKAAYAKRRLSYDINRNIMS
ncbi:hypothetical protein C0J45_12019 [Silurus meridionalis]|nr:hypothetical protein C0J45_12019 [Silurus meridionalis]